MKKNSDYIEDETSSEDLPDLSISEEEERNMADAIAAATHERRMQNWERAMILTQQLAEKAGKALVTEFRLRVAQLLAIVSIAIILLVR